MTHITVSVDRRNSCRWPLQVKNVSDILQGNVATNLVCGKIFNDDCVKFTVESEGERILKIWHLSKLQ